MTRLLPALGLALAVGLLPLVSGGHSARASTGTHSVQTVVLRRQACTAPSAGTAVGTARFAPDDQGGIPGGLEIDVALTAGLPRRTYRVTLLGMACQVLFTGGTLTTDDRGRGDLSVHVPSSAVPPGAGLRVQVVAPDAMDTLTSDPTIAA